MLMSERLARNLSLLTKAFRSKQPWELSTLSLRAYGKASFFEAVSSKDPPSFSARKYDEVVAWFEENWPEGAEWPAEVPRHKGH